MHLQFQEAVASGLAILAYNHWSGRREDEKLLLGYDPLKALEMLRGLGPRGSSCAAAGSAGCTQLTSRRRLPMKASDLDVQAPILGHELVLCAEVDASGDGEGSSSKRPQNPYCQHKPCAHVPA